MFLMNDGSIALGIGANVGVVYRSWLIGCFANVLKAVRYFRHVSARADIDYCVSAALHIISEPRPNLSAWEADGFQNMILPHLGSEILFPRYIDDGEPNSVLYPFACDLQSLVGAEARDESRWHWSLINQ